MALYPIKMLKDNKGQYFFPFITDDAILMNGTDKTVRDELININEKLENMGTSNDGIIIQSIRNQTSDSEPFVFEGKKPGIYILAYYNWQNLPFYMKGLNSSEGPFSRNLLDGKIYIVEELTEQTPNDTIIAYFFNEEYVLVQIEKSFGSSGISYRELGRVSHVITDNKSQTITGVKTFSAIPKLSNNLTPTEDSHLVNKKYVDDTVAQGGGESSSGAKIWQGSLIDYEADKSNIDENYDIVITDNVLTHVITLDTPNTTGGSLFSFGWYESTSSFQVKSPYVTNVSGGSVKLIDFTVAQESSSFSKTYTVNKELANQEMIKIEETDWNQLENSPFTVTFRYEEVL